MPWQTLIIGAGPAGLASAGALALRGIRADVIEQAPQLGDAWRNHYDRLHLHTVKELSALPGLAFPDTAPRYVPRAGFVGYLEDYAAHFGIDPATGEEAISVTPRDGGGWVTTTGSGRRIASDAVVLATGANRVPREPSLPGLAAFVGSVVHSHDYRNGARWAGRRVLVIGLGNTGAEIALDLAECGATVAVSVRSPVNIVRRDVFGRPTQHTAIALSRLPPAIGDSIARLLRDMTVGDLSRHGLQTSPLSPLRQLREQGRTPVIDVGTVAAIRRGQIRVHPGIDHFSSHGVHFDDGSAAAFDAVILATGYEPDVARLFPSTGLPLDERQLPSTLIGSGAHGGLYFVGYDIRQPGGLLRTIAQQAVAVADRIAEAQRGSAPAPAPRRPARGPTGTRR